MKREIMKIGIIADTRATKVEDVPKEVSIAFKGVEMIIHAGGIHSAAILDFLETIAPVKAVGRVSRGHAESPQPTSSEADGDPRVLPKQIIDIGDQRIGIIHELWLSALSDEVLPGVIERHNLPEGNIPDLVEEYLGEHVDIVVFGRTLYALIEEHQGILFINPGSPSLPRHLQKIGNVAILDINNQGRTATLIDLKEFS